jgi:hypothetical protein
VKNNLFRNIRGPNSKEVTGPTILFWGGARNTTVENNVMVNCNQYISFGLVNNKEAEGVHDHEGGIIRNNIIWREPGAVQGPEGGIMVRDSPGTKVLHNTVILNGTFAPGAIEYRWCDNVVIANNLTDGPIWQREAASAIVVNNVLVKDMSFFSAPAKGDMRLAAKAAGVLDQVPLLAECLLDIDGQKRGKMTAPGADGFSDVTHHDKS